MKCQKLHMVDSPIALEYIVSIKIRWNRFPWTHFNLAHSSIALSQQGPCRLMILRYRVKTTTCSAICCCLCVSCAAESRLATTFTCIPLSPLTLVDPGWKQTINSFRSDNVALIIFFIPLHTLCQSSSGN